MKNKKEKRKLHTYKVSKYKYKQYILNPEI